MLTLAQNLLSYARLHAPAAAHRLCAGFTMVLVVDSQE